MEAFLVSTGVVALAEIGDKTQLLAFILAAKYRKPWPIVAGIFVATIANHAGAGALGAWLTSLISPAYLRWVLGISFLAMALWTLIPDKFDEKDAKLARSGVFGTTLGMMIADVPAVFVGGRIADRLPVRLVHAVAASIFAILGTVTLLGGGERFGGVHRSGGSGS